MFDSKDILYIVLAFAVLWLTAFFCWLLYQMAVILRNVNETLAEARDKISKIEQALDHIRDEFGGVASSIGLLAEGGKKVFDYYMEKRSKKKRE